MDQICVKDTRYNVREERNMECDMDITNKSEERVKANDPGEFIG